MLTTKVFPRATADVMTVGEWSKRSCALRANLLQNLSKYFYQRIYERANGKKVPFAFAYVTIYVASRFQRYRRKQ